MHQWTLALLASLPLLAGAAEEPTPVPQQGYSTATLREPLFDAAQVAVETVRITNWLGENHEKVGEAQQAKVREHLYYLIDSRIKQEFAATGRILPKEPDLQLGLLLAWAEPMGVYGGNLVYNAVKVADAPALSPTLLPPEGMTLALRDDLLVVKSELGWSVSMPYYFMIGRLADFKAITGLRTQLMIVSTGAAKDRSPVGYSQATLMLIYTPQVELAEARKYWEQELQIKPTDERVELGVRGLVSQRNHVDAGHMWREIVSWQAPRGAMTVTYMGNDGTYEWNRPHFIDFLRALQTPQPAR
ncbi:MAG TPA: hypothetical protein VGQ22_02810 [Steroidobacteraceae bacterium]|jgi:hypothetical protein|nr:hypothetical protein [Steroidobacteraceae bacterium]